MHQQKKGGWWCCRVEEEVEEVIRVLTTSFGLLLAGTTPAKQRQRDRESINDLLCRPPQVLFDQQLPQDGEPRNPRSLLLLLQRRARLGPARWVSLLLHHHLFLFLLLLLSVASPL